MRKPSRATEDVLLFLLNDAHVSRYGLEIMRGTDMSSGTLYPILDRLEDRGLVVGEWEDVAPEAAGRPRRRYYRLSDDGVAYASEVRASVVRRLGAPAFGGAS